MPDSLPESSVAIPGLSELGDICPQERARTATQDPITKGTQFACKRKLCHWLLRLIRCGIRAAASL